MNNYLLVIIAIYFQDTFFSIRDFKYFLPIRIIIFFLFIWSFLYYIFFYKKNLNIKDITLKIFIIISFYIFYFLNFFTTKNFVVGIYAYILTLLNRKDKNRIYILLYKGLYYLCFLGLVSYIFFLIKKPSNYTILPTVKKGWFFIQYLAMVILKSSKIILYRFQSIFNEPGELGTIIGMILLFDENYKKLKKERIVLIISGVLTFSLAFYIFMFFKFLISEINLKKKFLIVMFLFFCFGFLGSSYVKNINGGELYYRVYVRIKTLNFNRKNKEADLILKEFYKNGNLLIGTREKVNKNFSVDISSIESIIYEKGFLGLGILILFFIFISNFFSVDKKIKIRIIIFLLSIYQRPNIFQMLYLLILITGVEYSQNFYLEKNERSEL